MSSRRTRRRRRARKHGTATLVLTVAAAALAAYRAGLVLAVALTAVSCILVVAGVIARRHAHLLQVPAQPVTRTAPRPRAAPQLRAAPEPAPQPAPQPEPQGRHALPDGRQVISDAAQKARDARARKLGWLAPKPKLLSITAECAGGECLICPAPGQCECECDHDPQAIMDRNAEQYDLQHANGDIPPY